MKRDRTYISCLEEEIERLEGVKELYKGSLSPETDNINKAIQEYKGQYAILTGTPYEVKE